MMLELFVLIVFPLLMVLAATSDIFTMTIPNRLTLALVVSFVLVLPFSGLAWQAIGLHFLAGLIMFALAFLCFAMGWIGGGDAKLATAAALWLGPDLAYEYLLWTAILGGPLTIGLLLLRNHLMIPSALRWSWARRLLEPKGDIPYGVALGAAGMIVFSNSFWMQAAIGKFI